MGLKSTGITMGQKEEYISYASYQKVFIGSATKSVLNVCRLDYW